MNSGLLVPSLENWELVTATAQGIHQAEAAMTRNAYDVGNTLLNEGLDDDFTAGHGRDESFDPKPGRLARTVIA